ncbi:hypothetical protein IscW_ISCW017690 [Ixodes scapularis]|uniref:Uncharacterized protein n=1 Tax=Ixodes scapularis TaxID=6945 RepID=B7PDU3_IXOSC|nr:hypothetical protein IscW_ISCW017690 [Ixodes scapularis]|eukprot:XP_002399285.1 hypothetical protein IscW_ISCW017690 [Ixodes scapularis]
MQVTAGVKKNFTLEVFFEARTVKVGIPLRTIVSKRGTWLRVMSVYLRTHLDTLRIDFNQTLKVMLESFREQGLGLEFTFESPKEQ